MKFKRIVEIDFFAPLNRSTPVIIEGSTLVKKYTINNKQANLEFRVENISGNFTTNCEVRIFGMTLKTFNLLNPTIDRDKVFLVKIKTGYEGDSLLSEILTGKLYFAEYSVNKGEFVATFKIIGFNNNFFYEKIVGLNTFPEDTYLKDVIKTICNFKGIKLEIKLNSDPSVPLIFSDPSKGFQDIGKFDFLLFNTYKIENDLNLNEKSVNESVAFLFENFLIDIGFGKRKLSEYIDFQLIGDVLYIIDKSYKVTKEIKICFDTGLITYPKIKENRTVTIETMLNPLYDVNTVLKIKFDENGRILRTNESKFLQIKTYKINEIIHESSGLDIHKSILTCREVE